MDERRQLFWRQSYPEAKHMSMSICEHVLCICSCLLPCALAWLCITQGDRWARERSRSPPQQLISFIGPYPSFVLLPYWPLSTFPCHCKALKSPKSICTWQEMGEVSPMCYSETSLTVALQKGCSKNLSKRVLGSCGCVYPTKLCWANGMAPVDTGSKIKHPCEED